jgi:hypothetical protein
MGARMVQAGCDSCEGLSVAPCRRAVRSVCPTNDMHTHSNKIRTSFGARMAETDINDLYSVCDVDISIPIHCLLPLNLRLS